MSIQPEQMTDAELQELGKELANALSGEETKAKKPDRPRPAEPAERLTGAGMIRVENADSLPLFYCAENGKWYGPTGHGFSRYKDGYAVAMVAEHGFNRSFKDSQGNSAAERAMLWLMQNRSVEFAGPLAGHPAGYYDSDGRRFLVTDTPRLVKPQSGADWPTIRQLVQTMLADEEHDQTTVFYVWAAASFSEFWHRMHKPYPWPFRHCPALGIFGPRHCGKTALIDLVLKPLFGNRVADPMSYFSEERFNKELFGASLLVLDDKGAASTLQERRERGEKIKDVLWKEEQRMEGKGADALMLCPFWRMVIAGNDDDSGLQVCPALSPSLEDKLLLLRCQKAEGLPTSKEENDHWAATIRRELPAFAAFLLAYRPPGAVKLDQRTRVVNFMHPELVAGLRAMQPEMRLLELIEGLKLLGSSNSWTGTASQFETDLRKLDSEHILDRLFTTSTSAGRQLSELCRIAPTRFAKTNRHGVTHYTILAK
jgi:hypothetical protein